MCTLCVHTVYVCTLQQSEKMAPCSATAQVSVAGQKQLVLLKEQQPLSGLGVMCSAQE